jgi:2-polyprenyl-3-methyl-5-hydroxy-6-metoxy-1,4-benzoquinol methylase
MQTKTNSKTENFNPDDFWQSRLTKVEGLEGVGYAKLGKPFNIWGYKVRKQAFYNIINPLKYDFKNAEVLDIGSGTGFYIAIWNALQAKKVTGLDITEVAVENLKIKFPEHQFTQLDIGDEIGKLKATLGHKDFISAMDVLFHIVDDTRFDRAVHNIASLLKPGGYFVYSDNFLNNETIRTKHQVSRSKKYLYDLFENAGLEVVSHKPFMILSNYPADSKNKLLHAYWFLLENTVALIKPLGHLFGAILFPIEKFLLKKVKDGPSSEIVLLRKK